MGRGVFLMDPTDRRQTLANTIALSFKHFGRVLFKAARRLFLAGR